MFYKIDFNRTVSNLMPWQSIVLCFVVAIILSGCAHPITINPPSISQRLENNPISTIIAGYVLTDADRSKQITTEGGGGDKVTYFPYKDLEKGFRDVLKSLYSDVVLVSSPSDFEAFRRDGVSIVFVPEIYTSSNSNSAFTWPPTQFSIDLSSTVTDATGNMLARVRASGQGIATFSEFKGDFGLAGRRAAQDAFKKLSSEIQANPRLKAAKPTDHPAPIIASKQAASGGTKKTTRKTMSRIPFPSDEYSKLATSGKSVIKGYAFFKTKDGDIKTAAGNEVILNPVTSYSNQWYEQDYLQRNRLAEADPRLWQYTKKKTADAEGRFIFNDVPPGDYYLVATILWEIPVGYYGAIEQQRKVVAKKITVKGDDVLDVVLTK